MRDLIHFQIIACPKHSGFYAVVSKDAPDAGTWEEGLTLGEAQELAIYLDDQEEREIDIAEALEADEYAARDRADDAADYYYERRREQEW